MFDKELIIEKWKKIIDPTSEVDNTNFKPLKAKQHQKNHWICLVKETWLTTQSKTQSVNFCTVFSLSL